MSDKETKKQKEQKIKEYHDLLEKYEGTSLDDIENDNDLIVLKKNMGLPVAKRLRFKLHGVNEPIFDTIIDKIYKPSYSCRMAVTIKSGKTYKVLSDYLAEMQKTPKKQKQAQA